MTKSSNNIETRAIESLLEESYVFKVPIKPNKASLITKLLAKLGLRQNTNIPKNWEVETHDHLDPKTGEKTKQYIRKIHIHPLYLGTIDSLRKLFLTINYDEKQLKQDPLLESRKLFKHIDTISEIASLATLNVSPRKLKNYNKQIKELKQFYKEHLTSRTLLELMQLISFMSNQADFTSSIRLTQMTGTTAPKANLVE